MNVSGTFESRQAPCGRFVAGRHYQDRDSEVVITHEVDYACGCHTIEHEYHDGSRSYTIVRHDGVVLEDQLISAE
jgi:membrane-bound inhibitor of C-type lysozyme